jgi:hypothetical protein
MDSFVISDLREQPGLHGKGFIREQLLSVIFVHCCHVADKRTGPGRIAPSKAVLGGIIDRLVDERWLETHDAGTGEEPVYRWTAAGAAWARQGGK